MSPREKCQSKTAWLSVMPTEREFLCSVYVFCSTQKLQTPLKSNGGTQTRPIKPCVYVGLTGYVLTVTSTTAGSKQTQIRGEGGQGDLMLAIRLAQAGRRHPGRISNWSRLIRGTIYLSRTVGTLISDRSGTKRHDSSRSPKTLRCRDIRHRYPHPLVSECRAH